MASKNRPIGDDEHVVIAVEGRDYLFTLLSQVRDRSEFSGVRLWDFKDEAPPFGNAGGPLAGNFDLLMQDAGFEHIRALGIIRDAEENREAQEDSVKGTFARYSLAVPTRQMAVADGAPNTGFLIMPHDRQSGCLEHALLAACALDPKRLECASAYFECIANNCGAITNPNHQAKIKIHAIIAGDAGKSARTLGDSASAGMWDFNAPSLKVMLDFIRIMRRSAGIQ